MNDEAPEVREDDRSPFEQTPEERAAFQEKLDHWRTHTMHLGIPRAPRVVERDGVKTVEIVNEIDGTMSGYTKTGVDEVPHLTITPTAPRLHFAANDPGA